MKVEHLYELFYFQSEIENWSKLFTHGCLWKDGGISSGLDCKVPANSDNMLAVTIKKNNKQMICCKTVFIQ